MSTEIEWNGSYRPNSDPQQWKAAGSKFIDIKTFLVKRHTPFNIVGTDFYFLNGSRFYNDTQEHLETALPECPSAFDVLKYEKWAERLMVWISQTFSGLGEFVFHKKSTGSDITVTRGCHENYLTERKIGDLIKESADLIVKGGVIDPRINYLILFLITRSILCGAGGIGYSNSEDRYIYEISPRTQFINNLFSHLTTDCTRAIINLRDEPLSDVKKFYRLHLILGDANMSDLSIFIKFGTTSAVIEMIEEGFYDETICLADLRAPVTLLKKISKDLSLNQVPIHLVDGRDYSAIEIQEKFCVNFGQYLEYSGQSGKKMEVFERWKENLELLKRDDEKSYRGLDWKIKQRLFKNYMDKKNLGLDHPHLQAIDLFYHSPDPDSERSFYYLLKNRVPSQIEGLISDTEIETAGLPPETRAKLRTFFQNLFNELGLSYSVNWDWVKFGKEEYSEKMIVMPDPRISSFLGIDLEKSISAINYLNSLRPGAIIITT